MLELRIENIRDVIKHFRQSVNVTAYAYMDTYILMLGTMPKHPLEPGASPAKTPTHVSMENKC